MAKKKTVASEKEMTAEDFIALPDSQKERIYAELDAESPQQRRARSRPLNSTERKQFH